MNPRHPNATVSAALLPRCAAVVPRAAPMPPTGQAAMAASYVSNDAAREVQRLLHLRWSLPSTLLSADLGGRPPGRRSGPSGLALVLAVSTALVALAGMAGALVLAAAVLVAAATGLLQRSRLAFDAMVARARRKGHAVLVVPEVPQALHEDVSALLFSTGVSWWDASV